MTFAEFEYNAPLHPAPVATPSQGAVLIVGDDLAFTRSMGDYLSQRGFRVRYESRGDSALTQIRGTTPDLVIMDLMLPDMTGIDVCRAARPGYAGAILMLTAHGDDWSQIAGLEAGADDFVPKSLPLEVLHARIRAVLRRGAASPSLPGCIVFGDLVVDAENRSATLRGERLPLTSAEFSLLLYLCRNPGRTIERDELHRRVRGVPYDRLDRSIDLRVSRLRGKLRRARGAPVRIESIRGVGYALVSASEFMAS